MKPPVPQRKRNIEQEKAEAVQRYQSGESIGSLSVNMGRTYKTIKRWLEESQIPILEHPRTPTADEKALMVALYREGKSATEVGNWLGWSCSTVTKYLRDAGVQMRPLGRRKDENS